MNHNAKFEINRTSLNYLKEITVTNRLTLITEKFFFKFDGNMVFLAVI